MKASEFIFKIAEGIFFSVIYLIIVYLASYLSIYWGWKEWEVGRIWFFIGFITYGILFEEEVNTAVNVLGVILNIGLIIYYHFSNLEPQLWIYIVLNTIICLNISTTCIKK